MKTTKEVDEMENKADIIHDLKILEEKVEKLNQKLEALEALDMDEGDPYFLELFEERNIYEEMIRIKRIHLERLQ